MGAAPPALTRDLRTAGANLVLLQEAETLARLLAEAGAAPVFLKGIALVESAYPDLSERPMDDIDVLVAPGELDRTLQVLRRAGYATAGSAMLARKASGAIPVRVDLHHELPCFSGRAFLARARGKSPGSSLRVLAPEDQLLHCIFHSVVQDGEVSARALEDARRIVEAHGDAFRRELFDEIVRREGWERPVALFFGALELPEPLRALSPYRRMLRLQSRPQRRLQLLCRVVFPPAAFLRQRYSWMPRPLGCLLPVLRPFFLGAAAAAGTVRSRLNRRS